LIWLEDQVKDEQWLGVLIEREHLVDLLPDFLNSGHFTLWDFFDRARILIFFWTALGRSDLGFFENILDA
jgi:hypothetical protein